VTIRGHITFFAGMLVHGFLIATAAVAIWATATLTMEALNPPQATEPTSLALYLSTRPTTRLHSGADGTMTVTGWSKSTDFDTITLGPAGSETVFRVTDSQTGTLALLTGDGQLRADCPELLKLSKSEAKGLGKQVQSLREACK
jgi:hypothetical protein